MSEQGCRTSPRSPARPQGLLATLVVLAALACTNPMVSSPSPGEPSPQAPSPDGRTRAPAEQLVGSTTCMTCHPEAGAGWQGSHHDRAMQVATTATVLGDFASVEVADAGRTAAFERQGDRFMVHTEGRDGAMHAFSVVFTFGVEPLQQYLVAFPDGRLQALPWAWDSRPRADGGQRWFHLAPDEHAPAGDPLHWTGLNQNANSMCIACHVTGFDKGYDPAHDRYETTWKEEHVGCEACHGGGVRHVAWAQDPAARPAPHWPAAAGSRDRPAWRIDPATGSPKPRQSQAQRREIEVCARCHARRIELEGGATVGQPLLDTHRPALLAEALYHADGQIKDEVYVYGSFTQSRMYQAGVGCSDCHDPHTLDLRAPGNAVCATCHLATRFDTPAHHHHTGSSGTACTACHMPTTTYLEVDPRHDHSLRVPRPDLTLSIGTPNACNGCHGERSADWAHRAVIAWRGDAPAPAPHFGEAIDAGRRRLPSAGQRLAALANDTAAPAIARATALDLLRGYSSEVSAETLGHLADDPEPLVRLGVVRAAEALDPTARLAAIGSLLTDPLRAIRVEAGRVMAPLARTTPDPAAQTAIAVAIEDFVQAQRHNADRPEAWLNLGWLAIQQGDEESAETAFRRALDRDPTFTAATINLAELARRRGRHDLALAQLEEAAARVDDDALLHYALGLARTRVGQRQGAVAALGRAAELAPNETRFTDAFRLALEDVSKPTANPLQPNSEGESR